MPESSHVLQWEDELPVHPIVDELRAQPGRWAIVSMDTYIATRGQPNLQRRSPLWTEGPPRLRWLPDPVVAAIQILKGGGYT